MFLLYSHLGQTPQVPQPRGLHCADLSPSTSVVGWRGKEHFPRCSRPSLAALHTLSAAFRASFAPAPSEEVFQGSCSQTRSRSGAGAGAACPSEAPAGVSPWSGLRSSTREEAETT